MPSRPKRPRRALSVTSLIDVIFLLLLFFMLSSTFTKFADVELMTGRSGAAPARAHSDLMFLRLNGAEMRLNGQVITSADLVPRLQSRTDTPVVMISLTTATTAQALTNALVQLRQIPGLTLTVLDPA